MLRSQILKDAPLVAEFKQRNFAGEVKSGCEIWADELHKKGAKEAMVRREIEYLG